MCSRFAASSRRAKGKQARRTCRAFSLVELLVVMVIIGMLAGLVVFKTRSYLLASKKNAAQMEVARIVQGLESFYAAYDRYPSNDEGLAALVEPSEKFPDGILNKVPLDPWSHAYQYNSPGQNAAFEVICLGADGREGGEGHDGDIRSDEIEE